MATTAKPRPAAKKAAATKPTPAKKAAPAKKAVAKAEPKGRTADPEKVAAREALAAERAARREAREAANEEQTAIVVQRRSEGHKWPEIAAELNISVGKAMLLHEYANAGKVETPTPGKVKAARDEGKSWAQIMAQFGFRSKGAAHKMYAETGNDPQASFIGKGGRYFSHEDKVASQRTVKEPKAPREAKAAKLAGKPVFTGEEENDAIIAKLNGKTITYRKAERLGGGTDEFKIKDGSVKVGRTKAGSRVVQATDVKTGGARTVALDAIVKVAR